jgi:hypothetical protein
MATGNGEQEEGSGIFGETPTTKGSAETSPATATNETQPSLAANEGHQPSTNERQPLPIANEGHSSLSTDVGQSSNAVNNGLQPATNEGQQPATNETQPSFSTNQGQEPHNATLLSKFLRFYNFKPHTVNAYIPHSTTPCIISHGCKSQAPLKHLL